MTDRLSPGNTLFPVRLPYQRGTVKPDTLMKTGGNFFWGVGLTAFLLMCHVCRAMPLPEHVNSTEITMNAAVTLNFASSRSINPATALRALFRGVQQFIPTVRIGRGHQELVHVYERMASLSSAAGNQNGAGVLPAHADAIRQPSAN